MHDIGFESHNNYSGFLSPHYDVKYFIVIWASRCQVHVDKSSWLGFFVAISIVRNVCLVLTT